MLRPEDRTLLSEAIRPDLGYQLDHAFITTFTLDLAALLTVPLALTFHDWEAEQEGARIDSIAMLDAVRRYSDRLTVVAETGRISVPTQQQSLLAFLERAIHTVVAPRGGTFHPKVWLLRYVGTEELADAVSYRLISSSRNLTFSRAWDTAVVLDGELSESADRGSNKGIETLVTGTRSLIESTAVGLEGERSAALERIAQELPRVIFELPGESDGLNTHTIGFDNRTDFEVRTEAKRRLVISPFVGDTMVEGLGGKGSILVSRQSELDHLRSDPSELFDEVLVLSDLAEPEASDEDPVGDDLSGLHAKVFVYDQGTPWRSRVLIGSANATRQAFDSNVEFVIEMEGSTSHLGVAKTLGDESSGLRRYLMPYVRTEVIEDADQIEVDRLVESAVKSLAATEFQLEVVSDEAKDSSYCIALTTSVTRSDLDAGIDVTCRPISIPAERDLKLRLAKTDRVEWPNVLTHQVTALLAFKVTATFESARSSSAFVLRVPLLNPPGDRDAAVTRHLVSTQAGLLRYLSLLLADPDRDPMMASEMDMTLGEGSPGQPQTKGANHEFPLMERLVQAVARDPGRIDQIERLVKILSESEEGRGLLPDGFEQIWKPVLEAHQQLNGRPE